MGTTARSTPSLITALETAAGAARTEFGPTVSNPHTGVSVTNVTRSPSAEERAALLAARIEVVNHARQLCIDGRHAEAFALLVSAGDAEHKAYTQYRGRFERMSLGVAQRATRLKGGVTVVKGDVLLVDEDNIDEYGITVYSPRTGGLACLPTNTVAVLS